VLVRRVCENQGVLAVFMFEKIIDPADRYDHVLQVYRHEQSRDWGFIGR
jgi:hypothetical protein